MIYDGAGPDRPAADKAPRLESIMGALKAYIGYIVYQTATGGLYNAFQPIMMGMRNVLGMNLLVNDDSLGAGTLTAILEGFGRTTSLQMASMAAGFIFAILLVLLKKYTKCRSLIIQAAHPVRSGHRHGPDPSGHVPPDERFHRYSGGGPLPGGKVVRAFQLNGGTRAGSDRRRKYVRGAHPDDPGPHRL